MATKVNFPSQNYAQTRQASVAPGKSVETSAAIESSSQAAQAEPAWTTHYPVMQRESWPSYFERIFHDLISCCVERVCDGTRDETGKEYIAKINQWNREEKMRQKQRERTGRSTNANAGHSGSSIKLRKISSQGKNKYRARGVNDWTETSDSRGPHLAKVDEASSSREDSFSFMSDEFDQDLIREFASTNSFTCRLAWPPTSGRGSCGASHIGQTSLARQNLNPQVRNMESVTKIQAPMTPPMTPPRNQQDQSPLEFGVKSIGRIDNRSLISKRQSDAQSWRMKSFSKCCGGAETREHEVVLNDARV